MSKSKNRPSFPAASESARAIPSKPVTPDRDTVRSTPTDKPSSRKRSNTTASRSDSAESARAIPSKPVTPVRDIIRSTPTDKPSSRKRSNTTASRSDSALSLAIPPDDPLLVASIAALRQIDRAILAGMVQYLGEFFGISAESRAIHIKLLKPTFSDELIAGMVGVNRTKLYTWPCYMKFKAWLKQKPSLPTGAVDDDGGLSDAWMK